MHAEIIAIGDELTSGQRLDTNSQWLAQRLGELGVRSLFHTTVGDDMAANVAVFHTAIERADIVVATGGLGPTADDLTRSALARTLGVELVLDEPSLAHIRALFGRRGRTMPPQNQLQAMFPDGSLPIPNPEGTAPGIELLVSRVGRDACRVFALPGVPSEMKAMWAANVAPAIKNALPAARVICHRRIKCYGMGESHLESMLPDLIARDRTPLVGITVSGATITLRITAEGASEQDCLLAMEPTIATIRSSLGEIAFGEEDEELEDVVVRLLVERGLTLATAECGTAGLLAQWLAEAQQAAASTEAGFLGGVVMPCPSQQWDDTTAAGVAAMANALRARFNANLGLAIGRSAPESAGLAAPRFHVALASEGEEICESFPATFASDVLKPKAAKDAMDVLRRWLMRR